MKNCYECHTDKYHKMSCTSYYTFPPYVEIMENLYLGWAGARSKPEWKAVVSIITPYQLRYEQNSYICAETEYTGIVPENTPLLLIEHHDMELGLSAYYQQIFEFIDKYRKEGPVFVHCQAGISRSPAVVSTYLAEKENIPFDDAERLVKDKRYQVEIWDGFKKESKGYLKWVRETKSGVINIPYLAPSRAGW